MFTQDFQRSYNMTSSVDRKAIIQQINSGEFVSETVTGQKEHWWLNKHHPDSEIPKNIHLLGSGTIQELHNKYISKHGAIEWEEFINYTRELIKQNIMV